MRRGCVTTHRTARPCLEAGWQRRRGSGWSINQFRGKLCRLQCLKMHHRRPRIAQRAVAHSRPPTHHTAVFAGLDEGFSLPMVGEGVRTADATWSVAPSDGDSPISNLTPVGIFHLPKLERAKW